ncbi:MAG: intein/homing endonuclease, partial [Methanobacteriota archaeon]
MGRREQIVDQCTDLMDDPGFIRNIGIVAHVDHGKCVAGDTRIHLDNGSVVEAKGLFERIRSEGEETDCEDGVAYEPTSEVSVASLDRETGETESQEVAYATKREADESLIGIETSNGHVLETTPEHRYMVLNGDGVMEFERADSLSKGDTVVGARKVPADETDEETGEDLLRTLAEDYGFYVGVSDGFNEVIDDEPLESLYEVSETRLKKGSLKHAVWRGEYRLSDIVKICESGRTDAVVSDLYDSIEWLNYRGHGQRGEQSSLDMEIPDDLSDLFYLAGFFFGDGDTQG